MVVKPRTAKMSNRHESANIRSYIFVTTKGMDAPSEMSLSVRRAADISELKALEEL